MTSRRVGYKLLVDHHVIESLQIDPKDCIQDVLSKSLDALAAVETDDALDWTSLKITYEKVSGHHFAELTCTIETKEAA